MNKHQLFENALAETHGLDKETIEAVSKIHQLLYGSAEEKVEDEEEVESDEDEEKDEPKEVKKESKKSSEALERLYNILSIMVTRSNAYQTYHWNAESTSLHALSQDAYELYRDTFDKIAENIVSIYDEPIDVSVWKKVPAIDNRDEFYAFIEADFDDISGLRDEIEEYKLFGINSILDSFIDELTTIKYKLIRFFENSEKMK